MFFQKILFLGLLYSALYSPVAFSWGSRGHAVICEVAARLVENHELRNFLQERTEVLGHLCNIPDISWRDQDKEKLGDASHYVNLDKFAINAKDFSYDLETAVAQSKLKSKKDFLQTAGSSWWRTQQFFRRALEAGKKISGLKLPDSSTEQNEALPYNQAVFDFLVNLGVMGHFVADNSQPYHNTSDYNGYGTGNGGIHAFYETDCVDEHPLDLALKVYNQGLKEKGLNKNRVSDLPALLKIQSLKALAEIGEVVKADRVLKKSVRENELKVPA